MLKNKIIIKKIRNIFILLMAIIIMVGVYTNIRNSRAENVIQIEVEISDKSNKIDTQKITIDATETKDGNYLIKLPTSVNEFVVSKYYTTDGAEVDMINVDNSATDNTDCTLRLTETEIANKKLQLQTDYDTKEFTTDDQQEVILYKKELKNLGISDEAENDNSKTSKTSENVQEQEENQDNVIVEGYMLPDTKAEITEIDTNTLTSVKLPDEKQSLKKAYEVSTYRMVENTSAVQNETAEQSNNTEEQETVEEQDSVQAENIETQQESEQAVTTEKVEYNPAEYGENLTVKIKNTEENTVATAYSLTEDGKIVDSTNANTETNTDASESAEQTSQASSATNGEYAETSVDKKETAITVVLAAEEVTTADENEGIDEITDINEVEQNEEDVNYDDQIVTTAATGESTLKTAIGERSGNSNFLGENLIKRENIDNITFESSAKLGKARSYYDAKQNTLNGHSNTATTWSDLARHNDATLMGGTFTDEYLKLDGVDDWVNLGQMKFTDSVRLEATISISEIQNSERNIVGNWENGGAGIYIKDGKAGMSVMPEGKAGWVWVDSDTPIKLGVKTQIVGEYDGKNISVYVDGKLVAQQALTGKLAEPENGTVCAIGVNPSGNGTHEEYEPKFTKMNVYSVKINEGYIKTNGSYDATNNTGNGHSSSTKTWVDATGTNTGTVTGGTWGSDYLRLNGNGDWVNLGEMSFDNNSLTLDAVISANTIQSGERDIVCNFENGGVGLYLADGVPVLSIYIEGVGYTTVSAGTKLTVGTKTRITGTYDGVQMDIYINGQLKASKVVRGAIRPAQSNTVMAIGCNPAGDHINGIYANFANIDVYSVRVYDEVVWDFSANNDNSILGWYDVLAANRGGIRVYIGSNNKIYANQDSGYLFNYVGYNADSLTTESITNIELLNTTKVKSMSYMFYSFGYKSMTKLDLGSNFYTSNVTNMKALFKETGYTAMTNLNLGDNFDTSNVTDMSEMFDTTGRESMTSLDLGDSFDTSNVTNMYGMFAECGRKKMTDLNLGSKFNTSNVTDMGSMFQEAGEKLTSLDLGDSFYTSKVTDIEAMFYYTGYGSMTSLDLGPAFTNMVQDSDEWIFEGTGKDGELTIYAPEAIYKNKTTFKTNSTTDTVTNTVTTGTIEPKYRTEWVKESVTVNTSSKNMQIVLRGRTNAEAGKDYISDVTSSLAVGNIKVLVDGTDISSSISKTLGTATQTTNVTTGAKDVLQTLTLSGFEQSKILSSKRYKDWSGNITIQVAQGTLKDNTYGNKNIAVSSAGARMDHTLSDAVVSKNTASTLFTDYISPSVIFKNSETVIDKTNKTYKMIFDVTDKYYDTTYKDLTLADLTIKIGGEVPDWNSKEVIRSLNSSAITATVDGASKTVGKRYTLTLSNLEQLQIKQGDNYLDYSGVITVAIPAGKAADYSGNKNVATTVTSGIDLPGGSGTGTVVDVVQPFFEKINSSVDATNKTATLEFSVTDKYFKASTLTRDNIKVFINGTETTSGITKKLTSTNLTEDRVSGSTTTKVQYGIQYTLNITGFSSDVNQVKVRIPAGLVTDNYGNSNKQTDLIVYNVLKSAETESEATSGFLGSTSSINTGIKSIQRQNIDNVTFVDSTSGKNSNAWDVSAQGDNSIIAWYTQNANGSYKVYIGSDYEIFGNKNSSYLFSHIGYSNNCTSTETITNINLLNTSNVTDMRYMFGFTGYGAMTSLDLGEKFDTSNVKSMDSMFTFTGDKAMTSLDLGDKFDTSSVTSMAQMFYCTGKTAMTSLDLGEKFDTSNVTSMAKMFYNTGYTAMTSLNLGDKFDTSSVKNMDSMFCSTGHTAMTSLDLGEKFDTSNVTDMSYMFGFTGYGAMTSLDLGEKFDTSNVKSMDRMFTFTGDKAMTSLDLGDKFDTSSVTDMRGMFYYTGYKAMTSLDLGDKFDTSSVTDMSEMFYNTGYTAMTSLDLGPAFTNIASKNESMFSNTGKSGLLTIYAPEAIFQDKNNFKLNASATTAAINYTRGTINPKYRTEWVKEGTTVDTTNKNIQIKLRGRTNAEAGTDYVSDVTSSLAVGNIKILVEGTDITSIVTKTLGTATQTTNATTGAKDVLQTLTLSNFAEATRRTGKSYKEWSGNITVEVAQKTLTDTTYGNKNMALTSAGARANNIIADTTKVDKNTAGSMFTDYVKPEITYVYSSGNINQTNKTLTVDFSVVDKYFNNATFTKLSDGSYDASAIKVTLKDTNTQIPDAKITKKLTKVSDVTETRDGASVKIGEKYRLVIGGLEQVDSNGLSDGTTYSGPMSVTFPEGIGVDKSSNKNPSTTITIGVNEPGGSSSNQQVVDVVDPVWTKASVDISTGTIKLRVKDKYLGVPGALDASKIKVLVNGVESTVVTKTITGPTQITANQEYEYTLKLGNISSGGGGYIEFTPIDAIIGGKAKYRAENGGNISIEIAKGAISDKYGNKTKKQSFSVGNVDGTSPEVYDIQKTIDATNHKATFVFNVTDKNYDESDLVATNELTVWMDGTQIDSKVTKTITKTTAIKTTIDGATKTVGHQYTLEISGLRESDATFKSILNAGTRDYRDLSGTLQIKINASAAKDKSGNTLNTATTTLKNFVDTLKPEVTYKFATSNINKDDKSFTMVFDMVDKYYNASTSTQLTTNDLTIKIDGKVPDWTKVTKSLAVTDISKTITATDPGNANGTIKSITKTIGKRYTLTLSKLEQLQIKQGDNYLDYSGVVTVGIPANKMADTNGTKNSATTITSGVQIPGGTGSGTVVDVVQPLVKKESSSAYAVEQTATLKFNVTDKYFKASTISESNIKVFVNGTETTSGITKKLTSTNLTEDRVSGSTTTKVQYGVDYTLTITGFVSNANQLKVRIPAGLVTDSNGNSNKQTDFIVYNVLKSTAAESAETNGFLGSASSSNTGIKAIQRQNIDNVTFVNSTSGKNSNNWDVSAQGDGSILAWYTQNANGSYKVYIGSNWEMFGNYNSTNLFANVGKSSKSTSATTITNINLLNVGSVVVMEAMFKNTGYNAMTKLDLGSNFNTGHATTMNQMFQGTGYTAMTTLSLGSNFDTTNVTNMHQMFNQTGYTKMTSLNLGTKFNTSKAESMRYMFSSTGHTAMTTLTLGSNFDTSNVTDMTGMFQDTGYTAMTSLDLGTKFNTSKVQHMGSMFRATGNGALSSINLGSNFDTSNVLDMDYMFFGLGFSNMASLNLGTKFNTAKVTNMEHMFHNTGFTKLTSLDLGDKFSMASVQNTDCMFYSTGKTAMTSLDLGPSFTSIPTNSPNMFTNTGKENGITIYATEPIFLNKNNFKLNASTTTSAINYTRGTINAKYRTEWIKESVTVDTTNKNIQIKLRGRTNAEAGKDYVSDVTSSLAVGNIKILIDGTDITSMVTKKLGTASQTTNATTGAKDVLQTLTLSGFEQAKKIATGKSYKDWSGNITIQVAQGTLTDNTYGNKNIAVTSAGARADHTFSNTAVNKNTASMLFTDYVSPSVVFRNAKTVTDKTNKTYKMIFDVTDKYYDTTYADLTLNDLTIKIGGKVPSWSTSEVERKLTVSAITATVDGASKTVGKRYTLTLSKLEQLKIKDGDKYLDYSGVITVAIPAGKAADYSGNKNVATTITSGIDLPEESGSDKVVDVVDPLIEKVETSAYAIGKTASVKFNVTDKYFKASTITENNIKVLVNGAETTNGITKTLTSTALTEDRVSGETTTSVQYGVEYTLTVTGFASNANQVKIQIPAGLVTDNFGNGNKVTDMIVYNVLKPTYTGTYADQESKSTAPFLGNASIQRQNIDNITFVNNIPANVGYDETTKKYKNATTWDVSAQQDKSILAWYTTNANGSLKVYIGSDNEIFANQDSTDLFAYIGYAEICTSTETITNIDLLNVTSVISMYRMFRWTGSNAMTKLDLGSKFDTSNVENMFGMFGNAGYNKMTTFSLGSKFDTSNVTDMGYMFARIGYNAMTKLDLGDKFDTSNVTDMRYMFYSTGYTVMTSLDLGDKFDTSNVTNMFRMFKSCGKEKMTSLRLGNKFNTSKVYDMNEMFIYCGYQAMTSLDLGDLFYTTNVKDMYRMFYQCGATAMTSLDLGVAFTKIPNEKITKQLSNYEDWDDDKVTSYNAYDDMFTGTGKSGAVIYTPESIYKNRTSFKANSTDTITAAGTIAVSEGRTANPIYKPEWTKVSSALKPNATAPTSLEVTVKGNAKKSQTTNGVNINYNSNVTSTLSAEDIKVYINGELDGDRNGNGVIDAGETPVINISVTPGTLSNTAEATHKITLSNFEEAARQSGKSYKEWSGNISIKIGGREEATSTYTTKSLVDSYGNQSMSATDETGTWVNVLHKDADVDKNTDGKMFTDFIKPEFTYKSSNTQIIPGENGETNERIEVIFDVIDKYFASTKLSSLDASQITVGIDDYDKTELNKAITKTLEKVQDLTDTVNGKTNTTIGARYKLTIKDLDKGDGYKYSGYMTLSFAAGAVTDLSGNTSNATTITVGKDEPGGTGNGTLVDVVDPVWTLVSRDTDAGVMKLRVKDKYLGVPSLDITKIKVVVNGVVSDKIVRVIAGPTAITANKEYEYTITLSNIAPVGGGYVEFTPINPIVGGTAKYREENGGAITLRIDRGAVQDKNGNTNQVQNFDIGNMDETLPEIYDVQKTKDVANNKETFIFNVTDKNYDETDYITEDEIDIIVDKYGINDKITKKMLKKVEIITTVDGKQRVVGHQYTLEVSGFKETDSTFKTAFDAGTRKYRVWSGLTQVSIHLSAAKDKSGNTINPDTSVIKDFTDLVKPEVTYKYVAADINKSNKTFKMVLEVTDKYYDSANSTQLTIDDFVIKIDNEVPDWKTNGDTSTENVNKITKSLSVEDISATIPATVPGNINGTLQDSVTKVIGKRYTITLSNLEQLQIKDGDQYLDYSGIVTVAVPATVTRSGAQKNVMVDTSGNKLSATTVTSGIQLPGGSGTGTIVDVVDPLINKESSSANSATGQATLNFTATDKYFKASTLSESNIQVLVNGTVNTTVTKKLTKVKDLTETRVTNGTSSTVQVGSEYKLEITGFGAGVKQVKVKFPAGLVTDNNGNSNKETEIILYNVLKSATSESEATSGFLGSASSTNATVKAIQRQNIDNITFVNSTSSKNANVWDVSAQGDNSILAWCTKNSNGSYKVYIGSDSEIFGNRDSTQLFTYVGYSTLCTSTETITNINLVNVSGVVNMYRMFRDTGYRSMTKLDLGDNFDTSNVVYMNAMFEDTGNLAMTALNFGSKFNTSKVTEMYRMFSYCGYTKMTSLNLSTFDTSKVTNMEGMFRDCGYKLMTNLNLGNNFDTSNVTNMTEMFNHGGRESLTTLNLGTKFNTSKVTKMNGMFCWMGALTTLNLGTNFDTSNVTDMSSMFWGTGLYNLTSLKLGDKFDTSKVTNMNSMFYDFARFKLESLDLGDKFNTKNVTNMANMFYNTGSNKMTYLDLGAQFTKIPATNSGMFTGCGTTSLEIFAPESIYATITSFRAGN